MCLALSAGNIIDGDSVLSRHEPRRMRAVEQFTTCRDSFQEFSLMRRQAREIISGFITITRMVPGMICEQHVMLV